MLANSKIRRTDPMPLWLKLREEGYGASDLLIHFGYAAPPVPVIEMANLMGVSTWWSDPLQTGGLKNADGALLMDLQKPEAEIYVARGASTERARFTVAHEIGHLMLHDFDGIIHRDANGQPQTTIEREANQFAAALLMPDFWVSTLFHKGYNEYKLAHTFNVSLTAMGYRLSDLGLNDVR